MKMTKAVKEKREREVNKAVTNFMGGTSYEVDPLTTLKMVSASSIFGEPQYYRHGEFQQKNVRDGSYSLHRLLKDNAVLLDTKYDGMKTSEVMEKVIDTALEYDFEATLKWAVDLRKSYFMRLNPQIIMVRAAMHPKRKKFTMSHPGEFNKLNQLVMSRADEPSTQATYWLYRNVSKNGLPSLLKRSWRDRLENSSAYEIAKYRNANIGMIDTVRISHANSELINELMKENSVEVKEEDMTWNRLRSEGKSWKEILDVIKLPHMALLRNLRGIFKEINDIDFCKKTMEELKNGVAKGRQFPFRYFSAYKMIQEEMYVNKNRYLKGQENKSINHGRIILDALEECIDLSRGMLPKLPGKTMCLSDNSGSAWDTFNSEYGKMTVAEINNLSSVLTAQNADEGYVGIFGDELDDNPVSMREGALSQVRALGKKRDIIGPGTENGVWLFLQRAIENEEHWDNIFVYSDQQAGHGGLYGTDKREYAKYVCNGHYIDVFKLVKDYRNKVNPKVNVFTVQTAGYSDVLIPENFYRSAVLYGWTGKESLYASEYIKLWNEFEDKKQA
ncbi:TROVE domain-containing protein [Bacillus toyonensis]|uniref:TROVE domain-containing protein n=1 Tax=Bacillus toyonensis TaxID=155322 RepID=UPI002E225E76|nr:TROVE domain-containing protein [Bacillus toyonensis]MED2737239.1 TROVE domain-containing protein [Bacillus toyonensis]